MKALFAAAAVVTAASTGAALAQESPAPWELRADVERDNLDQGQPDWREEVLQLAWKPRRGLAVLGGLRDTERFNLKDREGFAAAYLPIAEGTGLRLEGSLSDTHRVLARDSLLGELSRELGHGWVASAGGKLARYDSGDVRIASATVEKYFGDYRVAYTGYLSRGDTGGWAPAHRIAASWYGASPLTNATLFAARGRELENIPPAGLVTSDVRSVGVSGSYGITSRWGVSLDAGSVRQGDLYTRRYARLGTRILF